MTTAHPLWNAGALWAKAQVYMRRALGHEDDTDEHALNCALALEFVGRAALAHVHPVLLVDDAPAPVLFDRLLVAVGHPGVNPKASLLSVGANVVYDRCSKLYPDFAGGLLKTAIALATARNEELHTGIVSFESFPAKTWRADFYWALDVLARAQERTLLDLLGPDQHGAAVEIIRAAQDKSAQAVKSLVEAHKKVYEALDAEEKARRARVAVANARPNLGHVVTCPACGLSAVLEGDVARTLEPKFDGDGGTIAIRASILPRSLTCAGCGLTIKDFASLHALNLGQPFTLTRTMSMTTYLAEMEDDGEGDYYND